MTKYYENSNGDVLEYTPEMIAQDSADSNKPPTTKQLKMAGVEFEGVMCSATAEDMWGLNSIESWVRAGNDVPYEFENGNVLILTSANIDSFRAVWIPFRASFF